MTTKRQKAYLSAMREFFMENDQLPPVNSLAEIMGVHPNAAQEALDRLARAGQIERNAVNKWRFAR